MGAKPLALHAGEKITEGLDGLRGRLAEHVGMGARFAKRRAVIGLEDGQPRRACVLADAQALARYAALCQEAGIVPVVEPEVLMAGHHGLERCREITGEALHAVFGASHEQGVALEATILKPNMVLPGLACRTQESVDDVASETLRCLVENVPAAVPASPSCRAGSRRARVRKAQRHKCRGRRRHAPWPLVFSFARAIQQPALGIWGGQERNVAAAQAALVHRARCTHAAIRGEYFDSMEDEHVFRKAS